MLIEEWLKQNPSKSLNDFVFINGVESNKPVCYGSYLDLGGISRPCAEPGIWSDGIYTWCRKHLISQKDLS